MPDNPFSDREVNREIAAKILRLQAASFEWDDNPDGRSLDDFLVETLVESLNAHAGSYLHKVCSEDLISQYGEYMRGVGSALIRNAKERGHLSDPYSEGRLRELAENSGRLMNRILSLNPEERESEIQNEIERLRAELMPEALEWRRWRSQILSRIETRFGARYLHWTAEAIVARKPHDHDEQAPQLIPLWLHEAIQKWNIEQGNGRPLPWGDSKFWREMGARFLSLRNICNDDGVRRHLLGLSRQWGKKLWYVKGDQDSVNELLNLWAESEVTSSYPEPDPEAPIQYTWLNDVLSIAVQPIHRAVVDGKSLQGVRHFDEEHTILLVSDYCIAAMDLCRDNANATLKRERGAAPPALPAVPATVVIREQFAEGAMAAVPATPRTGKQLEAAASLVASSWKAGSASNGSEPQPVGKGKRGRPQTIPDERKTKAAEVKASGGTNKQAAAEIYNTKYPTDQQKKNVPAILRHHQRKSRQSNSAVSTLKPSG